MPATVHTTAADGAVLIDATASDDDLALVIKAKLEAVAAGITSFEDEFLAHIMLPSGGTVGEWARPQLEVAYSTGAMPALLPGGRSDA